jgi:membrane associated rhomboid family serine protease
MTNFQETRREIPAREPAFNLPWPVGALILALLVAHAARVFAGVDPDRFALTSGDLPSGRLDRLLTYQFIHGGWAHVLMNSAFILAFGAPVARYLGGGWRGGLAFLAFFLICGVVAGAAYAGMADLLALGDHRAGPWALVGASGSASGLMAAAARLIQGGGQGRVDGHEGRLGSITGRVTAGMTMAWVAINAVLGLSGLTPGAAGVPVAWEAHIFGYVCGLLAVGPVGWLAGVRADHAIAL